MPYGSLRLRSLRNSAGVKPEPAFEDLRLLGLVTWNQSTTKTPKDPGLGFRRNLFSHGTDVRYWRSAAIPRPGSFLPRGVSAGGVEQIRQLAWLVPHNYRASFA